MPIEFDSLLTPPLFPLPSASNFDSIMDTPLVTPSRFLNEFTSEFRFTPGIMTRYASGDYNPFDQQFATEATPSVAPAADGITSSTPPTTSSSTAPTTSVTFPPSPTITPQTPIKTSFAGQRRPSNSSTYEPVPLVPSIITDRARSPTPADPYASSTSRRSSIHDNVHPRDLTGENSSPSPTSAVPDSWHSHPQYADPTLLHPSGGGRYSGSASPVFNRDRRDSFQSVASSMEDFARQEGGEAVVKLEGEGGGSTKTGSKRKAGVAGMEDPDEEEKRKKFLERNRLAASKCRQKKKAWMQELERRSSEISAKNRHLQMVVHGLKEEILVLKNQLLLHRNCECNVIQQYISSSSQFAQQVGQGMMGGGGHHHGHQHHGQVMAGY
ncbi:hypothetical protein HDV00_008259 [Rhizophlyctis rosea]|nr:hypothetical protein HDV00_008259 [Rhizophlyctis rosea]